MPDTLTSDVIIKEETPTVLSIPTLPTAVLGMVGVSTRGPVDKQVIANSFDEWERVFGGYNVNSDACLAVKGFFENGGTELHFVRTVHHSDPTDPTTKTSAAATLTLDTATTAAAPPKVASANSAPWLVHNGETLVVNVDGAGGYTATFLGAAASLDSGTGTFALSDGQTLLVGDDRYASGGAQTITFHTADFVSIGAATAAEVAAVINAQIVGAKATVVSNKVRITGDTVGTASNVHVTGGSANGALGFSTVAASGTGNCADLGAVSSAEAISLLNTAATGHFVATYASAQLVLTGSTAGASHTIQVTVGSTAGAEFGFDHATHSGTDAGVAATLQVNGKTDGTYANALSVQIGASTNPSGSFNLYVLQAGIVQETWPSLSMTPGSTRYALTVVNDINTGSNLVSLVDLGASGNNTPAQGTFGPLSGGGDGLAGLVDNDFIGGTGVNGDVGLRCLDEVFALTLLCVPARATATVHNAMITYCEVTRNGFVFAILDPPANQSATQIVDYVRNTAALQQLTEHGAIYWPRVLVDNPSQAVFGPDTLLTAAPSGHLAGLFSRVDSSTPWGVFQQPAGTDFPLIGVRGLEMAEVKKKAKRELVSPELINPISIEPGTPYFVDGTSTLKSTGNWPSVGQRRGISFVEASLKQGLVSMRHKNITDKLLAQGRRTTQAFLAQGARNDAFASKDPAAAFTVDFGPGLNTAQTKLARQVWGRVGIATASPAEFVFIKIAPDTRQLDAELAALATA